MKWKKKFLCIVYLIELPKDSEDLHLLIWEHTYAIYMYYLSWLYEQHFLDEKFMTFFLIYGLNIDFGWLLESPQWGSSNKDPQSMFWEK